MSTRRAYLPSDARHEDLLEAAGRLFEHGGIEAVNMVAIAKEAGVSRALVYQHFPDLASVVMAFFEQRAEAFLERGARREPTGESPLVVAFLDLLELPETDLRGLCLILSGFPPAELLAVREQMRSRLVQRWLPGMPPGRDPDATAAAIWAVVQTSLSLAVSVRAGELGKDTATAMWMATVRAVVPLIPDA